MIIKNIGELVGIVPAGVLRKQGAEMAETGVLRDAWLAIEDGRIAGFGPMTDLAGHDVSSVIPGPDRESSTSIVLPGLPGRLSNACGNGWDW